jgi:hypothetical protein
VVELKVKKRRKIVEEVVFSKEIERFIEEIEEKDD